MADVFDEGEDSAGLDNAEQIENTPTGEYEINEGEGSAPTGGAEEKAPQDTAPQPKRGASQNLTQALRESREKYSDLERRFNDDRREYAVVSERLRIFMDTQNQERARAEAQRAAQENPPPDRNEDPIGYAHWVIERQQEQLQALQAQQQFNSQQSAQQAVLSQVGQQVQAMQSQFAMSQPDYPKAFEYLAQTRYMELQTMGYSDEQIPQILEQEKAMVIAGCIQKGPNGQVGWKQNPAEVAYKIALSRGWNPNPQQPVQQAPAQPQVQANGNGSAQRVQQYQNRVNTTQALNGGTSPESDLPPSFEALAKMNERDFARFFAENEDLVDSLSGSR